MGRLAYATRKSYETFAELGETKWGQPVLEQVRTMAVEQWLRDSTSGTQKQTATCET